MGSHLEVGKDSRQAWSVSISVEASPCGQLMS